MLCTAIYTIALGDVVATRGSFVSFWLAFLSSGDPTSAQAAAHPFQPCTCKTWYEEWSPPVDSVFPRLKALVDLRALSRTTHHLARTSVPRNAG